MPHRGGRLRVASAFAQERDARYAMQLMSGAIDAVIDFQLRPVLGETGYVQMVVLEASFSEPTLTDRILTVMRGAHGVPVPLEILNAASTG